jgi:hypothetical protein
MRKFLLAAFAAVGLFVLAAAAQAGVTPAITFDNSTGLGLSNAPFTLGWSFSTNKTVTVSSLGVFDSGLDGLNDSYQVGLFDSGGNLLTSTTVESGTVDPLVNQFRYASTASVTLAAGGTYSIGALYLTGDDGIVAAPGGFGDPVNFGVNPAITFLDAGYGFGNTLVAPQNGGGGEGYFGPNFLAAAVPELSTWAMMIIGFGGVALQIRRHAAPIAATA